VLEHILKWLPMMSLLVQALFAWMLWSADKRYVRREEHHQLIARLGAIEIQIAHLPSAQRLNELLLELERLRGELRATNAGLEGFEETVKGVKHQLNLLLENELRG